MVELEVKWVLKFDCRLKCLMVEDVADCDECLDENDYC
jgi:hypothetical protein